MISYQKRQLKQPKIEKTIEIEQRLQICNVTILMTVINLKIEKKKKKKATSSPQVENNSKMENQYQINTILTGKRQKHREQQIRRRQHSENDKQPKTATFRMRGIKKP